MDLTRYLLKLAPDFSVLDLAEKYLYCDSTAEWDKSLKVDKLMFVIDSSRDGDDATYTIPFKRVLIRSNYKKELIFDVVSYDDDTVNDNIIIEEVAKSDDFYYIVVVSDVNYFNFTRDESATSNFEMVGVCF